MSIEIMSQVWKHHNLKCRGHLLVLLALADCADADGCCYPSIRYLAKRSLMTERHTARVIKDLETWKLLSHTSGGGFKNSNHYQINPDIVSVFKNPDMGSAETLTCTSYKTLTPMSDDPSYDPSIDPSSSDYPSPTAQDMNLTVHGAGVESNYPEDDSPFDDPEPLQSKPVPEKKATPVDPAAEEFIEWFLGLLDRTNSLRPTLTPKNRADWADTYRKMVKLDKRDPDEIRRVCEYARKAEFWKDNFTCPHTLRNKRKTDNMMWYDVFLSKMPKHIGPNGDNRAWVVRKSRWDGMSVEERLRTKA